MSIESSRVHDSYSITVLKAGSSVLEGSGGLQAVVQEVHRERQRGHRVVLVVSAFPGVTDDLFAQARARFPKPEPSALARYVATGETTSASFLGLALDEAGIPAVVVDADRVGLEARGEPLDSDPVALDVAAVHELFADFAVIVLPGFVGRSTDGLPSLLGRGGSDVTALFVAHELGGHCRLLKDVEGLYTEDFQRNRDKALRYVTATWDEAERVGGKLVQGKAIRFARDRGLSFSVGALGSASGTLIGPGPNELASPATRPRPTRVALLGLGTVGLGVFRALTSDPERFEVVGIAVRDLDKKRPTDVARELLTDRPDRLLERPTDVVIEVIGGLDPATTLVATSLARGRDVVTANKDVIAHFGDDLREIAANTGARLFYSAAVGGAVPVIERVQSIAASNRIERIEGVLNGTCNFILDRLADNVPLDCAVTEAQELGFSEEDPSQDLCGLDSANKLAILIWEAFGTSVSPHAIELEGIDHLEPAAVREAAAAGTPVRLVASIVSSGDDIRAAVRPTTLPGDHPLSQVRGEANGVLIKRLGKTPELVTGKGAGSGPTTLSVLADLMTLRRSPLVKPRSEPVRSVPLEVRL